MPASLAPATDTKDRAGYRTCDTVRSVVGDARQERFEAIAPALMEPLRRFLARRTDPATADDVLAETLLVCWRRLDDLPDDPLPWSYGVARNCLANAQRSVRRQERLAARIAVVDPPTTTTPDPDGDTGDDDLGAALSALREEDAELLRLWAWEQLTPAEIAEVLGITPNAASIRVHRAREKLKEELRKTSDQSGHEESNERRRT
jgi:RNA polymerase sigma-70 factor, ECF subfamily